MFSNLRSEGGRPNTLLPLARNVGMLGWSGAGQSYRVMETNLTSLRSFQVDLAEYYRPDIRRYLDEVGLEAALWICPPRWTAPSPTSPPFRPFDVPLVEIQRLIGAELRKPQPQPFFVTLRPLQKESGHDQPALNLTWDGGEWYLSFFVPQTVRWDGKQWAAAAPAPSHPPSLPDAFRIDVLRDRSWLRVIQEGLVRFRSFDEHDSPCRH
mmetsp:Transcript_9218/g.22602  ORF Transcript_9218/g.22602 Transcript_9218/m.22602 type:complete len:210 (+) Transcript_9218:3-632(+)